LPCGGAELGPLEVQAGAGARPVDGASPHCPGAAWDALCRPVVPQPSLADGPCAPPRSVCRFFLDLFHT